MSGVALITGGQGGIGRGVARALAGAGFAVALVSLPEAADPEVQAALQDLGATARYYRQDLREIAAFEALLDRIEADLGPITTLVANAGIASPMRGDLLDLTPQNYDLVMEVNLRAGFFLAQAVARRMDARPQGAYRSISFVTSVSAEMASVERAEYCLSKAGASMMARLFALRLAPKGIGVFELRPGIIATAMTAGVRGKYDAAIADGLVPAGRWGQPGDVGAVMVPIATGQMAYATGSVIAVDGGLSVPRL